MNHVAKIFPLKTWLLYGSYSSYIATIYLHLPCVKFIFPFLRLEKHHNKMTTSNSTAIQKMTPITDPAMIPTEEPPPLALPLSATDTTDVGVLEVVGVILVVPLVDTIEVVGVSLVDTIEVVGVTVVVSLVDTIEVVGVTVVVSLVDTIEVVGATVVVSLVDTIEVVGVTVVVSLVDTIEVVAVTVVVLLVDTVEVVGAIVVVLLVGAVEVVNKMVLLT